MNEGNYGSTFNPQKEESTEVEWSGHTDDTDGGTGGGGRDGGGVDSGALALES